MKILHSSSPFSHPILRQIKKEWIESNVPNISENNALFLQNLICINKPKNILEIGTATGYSTIAMWLLLEEYPWVITTIDFSKPTHEKAKNSIKEAWLEDIITPLFWDALNIIPELDQEFDFIFIDGMMKQTVDFLMVSWDKLTHEWIILIDDVIKFKNKMVWLDHFLDQNNIQSITIPIDEDDGVMMIIKDSSIQPLLQQE